jgi:hypothetical protein
MGLFFEAANVFQDCLQAHPHDGAAQFYLEQCQAKMTDE